MDTSRIGHADWRSDKTDSSCRLGSALTVLNGTGFPHIGMSGHSAQSMSHTSGMPSHRETHSRVVNGVREFWWTETLWAAANRLPVVAVAIEDIAEFDENCWFGDTPPTCREVAEHARRIEAADLSHPVILNASGGLMDGGHRVAHAWLDGRTEVDAVRFATDPAPDWTVSVSSH